MEAQWKHIEDWPTYEVSSDGRVRNRSTNRVLKIDAKHGNMVYLKYKEKKSAISAPKLMRKYFPETVDGEEWREAAGYLAYEVSNQGRIRHREKLNILNAFEHSGYLTVGLARDDCIKQNRIHIIVARTFIPNDDTTRIWVNHKDGNKLNNYVDNLEWVTPAENTQHAVAMGLRNEYKRAVLQIDPETDDVIARFESARAANEALDIGNVGGVCRGTHNTCGGYKWEFEDSTSRLKSADIELLPDEEWCDCHIPGYNISTYGRVHSNHTDRLMTQQTEANGRISVKLSTKNGVKKTFLVHRLVAIAFIPNPDGLPQVDHVDHDPTNNHEKNLRWASAQDNMCHSFARKVRQITPDGIVVKVWDTVRAAGIGLGIGRSGGSISACCRGSRTLCKGFRWEYAD